MTIQNLISKLDLLDYFSQSQLSSLSAKDETFGIIVDHLDEFIKSLPEEKDKQILLQVISKSYLKYQDSITKGNGNSIFEININLLMAMLIAQKLEHNKDS